MKNNKGDKNAMRAIRDFFSKHSSDFKEGILELIITCVLLGIGIGVASIFSITIDSVNVDADTFIFIGIISLSAVGALFGLIKKLVEKVKNKKNDSNKCEDD